MPRKLTFFADDPVIRHGNDVVKEHGSNRDRRFDRGMRVVVFECEIFELKTENIFHGGIDLHLRKRAEVARKLQLHLLKMIQINMNVAEGVDKILCLQARHLRDHHREQSVRSDIKRNTQKSVRAALVKLAA